VEVAVLTPPAGDRMVGIRWIVVDEPVGSALVIGIPREFGHEESSIRAQVPGDCLEHSRKFCMVQRHRRRDRVEFAEPRRVLERCLDQTLVSGRVRIHADRGKAKLGQTVDQSTIATAEVQDPRTASELRRDSGIEVLPPPVVSHS
jgi:hypothetical protein